MNVLIIGSGGREHALAWKAAQGSKVETVFVAPGNAGTATENNIENVAIEVGEFEKLANFAAENNVGLTIVGPEVPLVAGIRDYFDAQDLPCFGPSREAAQLENATESVLQQEPGVVQTLRPRMARSPRPPTRSPGCCS